MDFVAIRLAFLWDCNNCGHGPQVIDPLAIDVSPEEKAELGEGELLRLPKTVVCEECGAEFDPQVNSDNMDLFDPDDEESS